MSLTPAPAPARPKRPSSLSCHPKSRLATWGTPTTFRCRRALRARAVAAPNNRFSQGPAPQRKQAPLRESADIRRAAQLCLPAVCSHRHLSPPVHPVPLLLPSSPARLPSALARTRRSVGDSVGRCGVGDFRFFFSCCYFPPAPLPLSLSLFLAATASLSLSLLVDSVS